MKISLTTLTATLAILLLSQSNVNGQDYNDYQDYPEDDFDLDPAADGNFQNYQEYADDYAPQDNLYKDYASKHDPDAPTSPATTAKKGSRELLLMSTIGGTGWFFGSTVQTARTIRKMKTNHMKQQKNLYSQYYNDVYKLQQQNAELAYVIEQYQEAITNVASEMENDQIKRDYDEFKQPDVDGDDRISRAEFSMYVKNYLSNYPGLTEADYPKFEDFDHDGDGFIGFQEYAQQMALTVQQAEKKKADGLA